jgi:hypothetical protein
MIRAEFADSNFLNRDDFCHVCSYITEIRHRRFLSLPESTRAQWGAARVAVAAKWAEIKADLDARRPMIDVYRRQFSPDPGITYGAFRRQVTIFLREQIQPAQSEPSGTTAPVSSQGTSDARSPSRTFDYKPSITAEDEERLAGR